MSKKRLMSIFIMLGISSIISIPFLTYQSPKPTTTEYNYNEEKEEDKIPSLEAMPIEIVSLPEVEFSIDYKKGYTSDTVNIREFPSLDANIIDTFDINIEVEYVVYNEDWVKIKYNEDHEYFMNINFIADEKIVLFEWDGTVLSKTNGANIGPMGRETYYNLNMSFIVGRLQRLGYEGKYWIREDGVKMFGEYILVAADFNKFPIGTIVKTSLGFGIVADTGGFCWNGSGTVFDIAVNWK